MNLLQIQTEYKLECKMENYLNTLNENEYKNEFYKTDFY